MRRLLPVLFLLLLAAPARAQSSATVTVGDDFFAPATVTVSQGATVTWTWEGSNPHNVKFNFANSGGPVVAPHTYRYTFNQAGTFDYICDAHPTTMTGQVVVRAAQTASPKPTTASPRPTTASPTPSRTPSPTPTPTPTRTATTPRPTTARPTTAAPTTAVPTTSPPATTPPPLVLDTPVPPDRSGLAIAGGLLVGLAGLGTAGLVFARGRRA